MLVALLLLLGAQSVPSTAPPAPPPHAWWRELEPAERDRIQRRWQDYQQLSPENREALKKRFETLEQERALQWRRMDERDRQQFEALAEPDRQRWLDERVRERIRDRGQSLERREPGFCKRLREIPPEERMHRAPDALRKEHAARARQDLEAAVQEGWIGAAAAAWLRQAPPEELLTAMGQVQRWRFLQKAEAEGFWQKHGVPPEAKDAMLELPVPFFFEEIRRLEQGNPPLGPPGNWRGGAHSGRRHHER